MPIMRQPSIFEMLLLACTSPHACMIRPRQVHIPKSSTRDFMECMRPFDSLHAIHKSAEQHLIRMQVFILDAASTPGLAGTI